MQVPGRERGRSRMGRNPGICFQSEVHGEKGLGADAESIIFTSNFLRLMTQAMLAQGPAGKV